MDSYNSKFMKPILIAEIGVNHNGSLIKAKKMIDSCHKIGIKFIKFQYYDVGDSYNLSLTNKKTYEWSKKLSFTYSEMKYLKSYCDKKKLEFICSVFDEKSLNNYIKLKPNYIKIPSSELYNISLLKKAFKTNKKIILSLGLLDKGTIIYLKKMIKKHKLNKNNCHFLYCVSKYPTNFNDVYLETIDYLKKEFNVNIGLSDHTKDSLTSIIATYKNVSIIEKHIKINETHKCPDESVSLTLKQFKSLREDITKVSLLNKTRINLKPEVDFEQKSIYLNKDKLKNEIIKESDLSFKKPNKGINAKEFQKIIGKKLVKNKLKNTSLTLLDLK